MGPLPNGRDLWLTKWGWSICTYESWDDPPSPPSPLWVQRSSGRLAPLSSTRVVAFPEVKVVNLTCRQVYSIKFQLWWSSEDFIQIIYWKQTSNQILPRYSSSTAICLSCWIFQFEEFILDPSPLTLVNRPTACGQWNPSKDLEMYFGASKRCCLNPMGLAEWHPLPSIWYPLEGPGVYMLCFFCCRSNRCNFLRCNVFPGSRLIYHDEGC